MNLILIDKDQTLVNTTNPNGFVNKPEEQVVKTGAFELIEHYSKDHLIFVVSNQGGVAKGYKKIIDVYDEMVYCNDLFRNLIHSCLWCPSCWQTEGDECWMWNTTDFHLTCHRKNSYGYRKPNPGMLLLAYSVAIATNVYDFHSITMIGDRDTDEQAAKAASNVLDREIVYKDINTLI